MASILMVLTSHDRLGDTGEPTGFWLEEFAAPYYVFLDAGHEVVLASPAGGQPPVDPKSDAEGSRTEATRRLEGDDAARHALAHTRRLAEVTGPDGVAPGIDAVFYCGGHGPLWDLVGDADSGRLLAGALRAGTPLGMVCHAPAVLHGVHDEQGVAVASGRVVTGFTNSEEEAAGLTSVVPFLLQDALIADGADFRHGDDGAEFTVTDGRLVTGQNPASSAAAARELLALLD